MDSLGNRFRTARESQGLTLEQMTARTRIQKTHLKALEEDSFERLPERVFTKGFVRAYARSLELDEEDCLRLFAECSASFYQDEKESEGLRKMVLLKEDEHKEKTSRVMVVLLVGGLILLGGIVLLKQQSPSTSVISRFSQKAVDPRDEVAPTPGQPGQVNDSSVASTEPAPEMDVVVIPAESRVDDGASTSPSSLPAPAPISAPTTRSADGSLVLEIRTLEMTWIVVRSDENEPEEALLQTGEVVQWRAHERFLLTLGNAGGVEVRLNGQLRGPFGETGVVVREVEIKP